MTSLDRFLSAFALIAVCITLQGCKSGPNSKTDGVSSSSISSVHVLGVDSVNPASPIITTSTNINNSLFESLTRLRTPHICTPYQARRNTVNTFCVNYSHPEARINAKGAGALASLKAGHADSDQIQESTKIFSKSPIAMATQIHHASAKSFGAKDLIVVDSGANDAADLVNAYLFWQFGTNDAGNMTLADKKSRRLSPVLFNTLMSTLQIVPTGQTQIDAQLYMQKLALKFSMQLKLGLTSKGAERVIVLDMPSVSKNSKIKTQLQALSENIKSLAIAQGKTEAEANQIAQGTVDSLTGQFDGWIKAYNQELNQQLKNDPDFMVVNAASLGSILSPQHNKTVHQI